MLRGLPRGWLGGLLWGLGRRPVRRLVRGPVGACWAARVREGGRESDIVRVRKCERARPRERESVCETECVI